MRNSESLGEITGLLMQWHHGDDKALGAVIEVVYRELHRAARGWLAHEEGDHTLPATALINETFLRFLKNRNMRFENRTQFFWFAGHLMRQILVDHARARLAKKRLAEKTEIDPDSCLVVPLTLNVDGETLLTLDEALRHLAVIDPRQVSIVELRFFAGFNLREVARAMKVSPTTVKREWRIAKRWLANVLER